MNEQQNDGRHPPFTVSALVFHVLPENFKSGTANRSQEKAAGTERPLPGVSLDQLDPLLHSRASVSASAARANRMMNRF